VYPDFARITQYTLLATDNPAIADRRAAAKTPRRRPRFPSIARYRSGDTSRQIDWKATARVGKLTSREYQDERDQRIVFLVDCGQRMRAHEGSADDVERALSHFDHALNALLLLAYVALRQGDAVGVQTFGHADPRWFAPRKSVATVNFLLSGCSISSPVTPRRIPRGGERLYARLTRRTLVVIVTNLRDEDDSQVLPALRLLRRRHLTLVRTCASRARPGGETRVRERSTTRWPTGRPPNTLSARAATIARLRREGARVIDAHPQELPRMLVNQYWQMKRAGEILINAHGYAVSEQCGTAAWPLFSACLDGTAAGLMPRSPQRIRYFRHTTKKRYEVEEFPPGRVKSRTARTQYASAALPISGLRSR
jgi:uncharacterized protein (DUF58 family)